MSLSVSEWRFDEEERPTHKEDLTNHTSYTQNIVMTVLSHEHIQHNPIPHLSAQTEPHRDTYTHTHTNMDIHFDTLSV